MASKDSAHKLLPTIRVTEVIMVRFHTFFFLSFASLGGVEQTRRRLFVGWIANAAQSGRESLADHAFVC